MNILLTGGSGFIGKNITESFLSEKYVFIAPSHRQLDLTNENDVNTFFKENKIDIVIHSATKPGHRNAKDPSNIFYADMRMFMNLVNNKEHYKKMIILGSGAVYDMRNYQPQMKEDYFGSHMPADEHGFYRYVSAKFIEELSDIVELRIFGIFGKYEDYAIRFISNAICKAVYDLPITIKQDRCFDYLYIDDLMPILDYFIQNNSKHKAYNITPGSPIKLSTLANKVNEISGKNLPIIITQEGMGLDYGGNNSRLKNEIKNVQFIHIDKAIYNLYNWYTLNKNLINKEFLIVDK